MGKSSKKKQPQTKISPKIPLLLGLAVVLIVVGIAIVSTHDAPNVAMYKEKIALLEEQILTDEVKASLGKSPAGGQAGQAVFISICNTEERASIFCGTGADLPTAWQAVNGKVQEFLESSHYDPVWIKADVVYTSQVLDEEELVKAVRQARHEFFRYGIAFDDKYETALLEAELNGAKIYAYDDGGLDFDYLNRYLRKAGRSTLEQLPETYRLFQCQGWLCDENDTILPLYHEGLPYGRRAIELLDDEYAKEIVAHAADFLADQVKDDGSFVYGIYPRFDNDIDNYNIVRHASTIWSLICQYRITHEERYQAIIERTIDYMLDNIIYEDDDTAYLYEAKADEIKLGGCGVCVITLTEYMDVFGNERYRDICEKLGHGILKLLNEENGEYYHVLNGDFTPKEKLRTVYYDGEATFALARLYGLTGDDRWLNAAKAAVDHFITADYTRYKDHWVAYAMNEITKYVDDPAYYTFALRNAQENLSTIYNRDTTYHTYLELLMASFELYDRMIEKGITTDYLLNEFQIEELLRTIYARADHMLNGYFYPEYAMYMANPERILQTFMVRHDGYRIRIDDVQHNIDGYYMYYKNYDKLVSYGMLEAWEK